MNIDSRVERLEDKTGNLTSDVSILKTELKYLRYIFLVVAMQLVGEVGLFISGILKI